MGFWRRFAIDGEQVRINAHPTNKLLRQFTHKARNFLTLTLFINTPLQLSNNTPVTAFGSTDSLQTIK